MKRGTGKKQVDLNPVQSSFPDLDDSFTSFTSDPRRIFLFYLIRSHTSQLADSEKRYRSYFADNPHPMWVTDARTMAFTDVNEAAIDLYGYTREEFMRMRGRA